MKITISKSQWEEIGKVAGWTKTASGHGRFSKDLSDILEGQVLINKSHSPEEIANIIKTNHGLNYLMKEEAMTDTELIEIIEGTLQLYSFLK